MFLRPSDGIAELRFDDAQKTAYATPEYAAAVADEPNLFEMNFHAIHAVITENIAGLINQYKQQVLAIFDFRSYSLIFEKKSNYLVIFLLPLAFDGLVYLHH